MKVLKVKTADIVSFYDDNVLHYGEVGPGKRHTNNEFEFEVYPIRETGLKGYYEYIEDPIWVNYNCIASHQSVRNRMDFQNAWISLEFNPIITQDNVYFERLFENQNDSEPSEYSRAFGNVDDMYTSEDDDNMSLRSADTYSTEEDSTDDESFIVHSECESCDASECDCEYCVITRESVKWCDRDWKPKDPTEKKVRSFIEYLENKYT